MVHVPGAEMEGLQSHTGSESHRFTLTVVLEDFNSGPRELGSRDDGGMVQLVTHNQTSLQEQVNTKVSLLNS